MHHHNPCEAISQLLPTLADAIHFCMAHGAVRTVTANQPACRYPFLVAKGESQYRHHSTCALREAHQLYPTLDRHSLLLQVLVQDGLGRILRDPYKKRKFKGGI
jgi:hypothetical protein